MNAPVEATRESTSGSTDSSAAADSATAESATSEENRLLQALKSGDEAAFAMLVDQHQCSLVRVAKGYVRDHATAEDVVQETWVGFTTGLERFEGRCSIRTWLFRILFNKAQSRAATEQRFVPFSTLAATEAGDDWNAVDPERFRGAWEQFAGHWAHDPPAWRTDPVRILADQEAREAVRRAIEELPKAQALVIQLRDVEGIPSREVCEILEISPANQRVLLHRARSRVRAVLERRFGKAASSLRS
jgi:RNA polymerase sigma-70 factor (ECF subfamily)